MNQLQLYDEIRKLEPKEFSSPNETIEKNIQCIELIKDVSKQWCDEAFKLGKQVGRDEEINRIPSLTEHQRLIKDIRAFSEQYPLSTIDEIQSFIIGWTASTESSKKP